MIKSYSKSLLDAVERVVAPATRPLEVGLAAQVVFSGGLLVAGP
jgi:hypothetical protein